MIVHSYKTIFIHINKTAGSSVQNAFHNVVPNEVPHCWKNGSVPDHRTAITIKNIIADELWRDYFKFAFVRNPWDRMVSMYHFRFKNNQSFNDWILWSENERNQTHCSFNPHGLPLWGPQLDWVRDENGSIAVDFIGMFETIESDWSYICKKINKKLELPHHNTSEHFHYSKYYNKTSRFLVEKWHKDDIEMFDYKFKNENIKFL